MKEYLYSRQSLLFRPESYHIKVFIYGIGSVGSNVCFALSKLGINDITVYDFDTVEMGNVPAQVYRMSDNGKFKVDAMAEITAENGIIITPVNIKIDDSFMPEVVNNSIHFIGFDSIKDRQLLMYKLSGYDVHVFDTRIGGFQYEKYYIKANDTMAVAEYLKTLEGTFTELVCGEKACYPINAILSGLVTADIIKIAQGVIPDYCVKQNIMSTLVIRQHKVK